MPPTPLESLSFLQKGLESVADPGEGPGGRLPLICRPNRGPKGGKHFLGDQPPLSKGLDDHPPPPPSNLQVWIRNWECLIKTTLDLIWIDFLRAVTTDVAMYELRLYYFQIPEILLDGGQESNT